METAERTTPPSAQLPATHQATHRRRCHLAGKCTEVPSGEAAGPRSHSLTGARVGMEPEPARPSWFPEGTPRPRPAPQIYLL